MKGSKEGWTWPERLFVVKSFLLLQVARLAVRWYGYQKVYRWIESHSAPSNLQDLPSSRRLYQATHLGLLVNIANRRFRIWQVDCLPESLAVWGLLRRKGLDARLRLGMRKQDGRYDGHAWVEYAGQVVSGDPNQPGEYIML
jgi:hypothetical protein